MNYLIDLKYLKENSYIANDVNDEILLVILQRVQDKIVEPTIGTKQYKRLLQGVEDSDLTSDEEELLGYLYKVLIVSSEIEAVTHNNWKITNKAVGRASDEHINSNGVSEANNLEDRLTKDLAFYKRRLIGYLQDNEDKYPLYFECHDNKEEIKPEKDSYSYKNNIGFI